MKIIEQSWSWVQKPVQFIESAGRTCYKSEDKITPDSEEKFIRMLKDRGHSAMIEHSMASVRFITNRGVTHELVRHRLCAFAQESTRYVDYQDEMEFIKPIWWNDNFKELHSCSPIRTSQEKWVDAMRSSESYYKRLRKENWRPEQAREVLPNSLKTEIVVTANLREWRHIFKLRCSKAAHPQIRNLMRSCLKGFRSEIPVLFDDYPKEYYL